MRHNTAIVMPLKAQSERVHGKNFRRLGNKPLYRWALDKLMTFIDDAPGQNKCDVNIYCDNATWQMIDADVQKRVWHLDEACPAQTEDSNDFFYNIAAALPRYEHIVYANATSPFVSLDTYRICMEIFDTSEEYDSVLSAVAVYGRVWNDAAQSLNHDPKTCPRTQGIPPVWIESDAFWMMDRDLIFKHHRRVGMCPYFHSMSNVEQIDINVDGDFEFAETMMKTKNLE